MKTPLFTSLIVVASLFFLNGFGATDINKNENISIVPATLMIDDFSSAFVEEDFVIESWMFDDYYWSIATETSFQVEEESELQIEEWMTNNEKWEHKKTTQTKDAIVEMDDGSVYVFRMHKEKEEPLRIESWMTDDRYWSL